MKPSAVSSTDHDDGLMVRALRGLSASLVATLAVLLATAWPSVADDQSRHYVEVGSGDAGRGDLLRRDLRV